MLLIYFSTLIDLVRLPFRDVACTVRVQFSLNAQLELPHGLLTDVLWGAKLTDFTLEQLDSFWVALGELLLQSTDKHVLEVVIVTWGACPTLNRAKLVYRSRLRALPIKGSLRWWSASIRNACLWIATSRIELTFNCVPLGSCSTTFDHFNFIYLYNCYW